MKEIIRGHGKFPAPDAEWVMELEHEYFRMAAREIVRPVCMALVDSVRRRQAIALGVTKPDETTAQQLDTLLESNRDVGATYLIDAEAFNKNQRKPPITVRKPTGTS